MKALNFITPVALLFAAIALAFYLASRTQTAIQRLTIEILRSIPRSFLVLETQREVAVASMDDGGVLFGPRVGHATASRRTHLGVNLEKVTPSDVDLVGRRVSIKLPDPEILDSAIDFSTVRMFTKRSGFRLLWDLASGKSIEQELLGMLGQTTPDYTGDDLRAQRLSFVTRLNDAAAGLFKAKGLEVEFR